MKIKWQLVKKDDVEKPPSWVKKYKLVRTKNVKCREFNLEDKPLESQPLKSVALRQKRGYEKKSGNQSP